ncbi:MAG: hypothetical protein QMC98_01655, partial [Candidatus Thermoplasmatota archaeon]|nr:hypothetical protein [Candidatus Thermoplasmatota archaeon]
PGDQFGYSVSGGDLNNDGYNDTIIGAPYNASAKGAVYIFNGSANIPPSLSALDANYTAYGENANDKFGLSVYLAGDINNDNYPDVIIGAPGYSSSKGRAYVYTTQPIGVIDNPPTANANIAPPYWKNSNTFSISWNATDDNNLVLITLYYRYSQDNVSWGSWTEYSSQSISGTSAEGNFTFDGTADGYYEFYVNATDSASQKAQSNIAKAGIDITKATSFVNTISPYWQNSTAFTITANASDYNATGGESGVKNISLYYRYCNDNVSWPPTWSYFDTNSTPSFTDPHNCTVSFTFTSPDGDGYYQFYSIAIDNATNEELAPAEKDALAGVDTQPPNSWGNPEVKAQSSTVWVSNTIWVNESTVSCRIECSDYLSKLNLSSAEYYYSTTSGSSWSGPFACSYEGSETTATIYANNVAFATGSTQSDGDPLRIRFRIKDKAGSWGSYWWKVKIDITAPNNPNSFTSTVPVDTWTNIQVINVTWSGHSDALSGVAGFYYAWTADSTTIPTTSDNYTTTNYNESPVLPEGYWYLHIRTKDNVSNLNTTAYHIGPFKIDITPPNNPTPPATETSGLGIVNDTWHNKTGNANFSWSGANDALSGVSGYYYYWGEDPNGIGADANYTTNAGFDPAIVDEGIYYLRVKTRDNASNNASWATLFVFKYDSSAPGDWKSFYPPTGWVNTTTVNCSIQVKDIYSGLNVSSAYFNYSTNSGTTWSGWLRANCTGVNGTNEFQTIWANVTLVETAEEGKNRIIFKISDVIGQTNTTERTIRVDATPPNSSVNIISPYWRNGSILITGTGDDALSGLNRTILYYYYSTDNSSWSGPFEDGIDLDPWSGIAWNFDFPKGEGYYRFYSVAIDNATNIEAAPVTNDTLCGYDATPPSNPAAPATETNGAQNNTWQNTVKSPTFKWDWPSDNLAGVEGFYWYFGLSETGTANNYITTNTTSCAGENGTYYFRIMTKDKAGNNASWVTLFVFKHDAQLPTITYNYPTAGSATNWYNADPGNVIDIDFCWIGLAPLDYAQYQINGGAWIDIFTADQSSDYTANWAVAWESLAEGENKISIRVADVAGNILTHTYTAGSFGFLFRKDTVMPSVTIETPQNGTTLYTTPIWINGTCNDTLSGINKVEINITYKENGTVVVQWSPVTLADNYSWWDYQFNPPTEANYTIKVRAVDNASNIATVQINITYSLVVPPKIKEVRLNITETNSTYTNTQIVKLNLTVSATNAIRVMVRFRNEEYFDWSDWFEYNISRTYNLFDWILAKADGTKTVYAEVNATGAEGYDLATASDDIILDATPPRIFDLKPEAFIRNITVNISAVLNDTLLGINWTTLLIKINGVDHTKNFTIEKSSGKLWNRALRPDGSYKCYIYVRDNANNSAEIIWTFTLDSTPITPNDIRFSHYNAMPGQRIKINVTIYKNETTHDHVKFRVIILNPKGIELCNKIITINRETFRSIEIEDTVEELGEERTDLAGRKYLAGNYTVRVIRVFGPPPTREIDRQTAILPIVYLKPPPEPVSSFEITLVSVLVAAVLAALISTLKKRQNK